MRGSNTELIILPDPDGIFESRPGELTIALVIFKRALLCLHCFGLKTLKSFARDIM